MKVFFGVLIVFLTAEACAEPILPWSASLDAAASAEGNVLALGALVAEARSAAELPIIRRARTLEEIGAHRTALDGRAEALEPEIREDFALAMSDFSACNRLAIELPLLAAGYRLTRDDALLQRVLGQLEEMAGWSPLQRPGWSLYTPGRRLPPDGKDGNWLATGCGIRAIGDTLDLLPEAAVDATLRGRIDSLLELEIRDIEDDWATQRSWFIKTDNPITNQWVLPTEGLVRACLILGKEAHPDAYSLGTTNLMKALDAHGSKGEFEEGFGYASFTMTSLLQAAHAMAVAGDMRAIEHPFLQEFPTWLVHHFQPGDMIINCFDAGGAYEAAERSRPLLSLLAVCTGSPVARWALKYQTSGPSEDLAGLAASGMAPVGPEAEPPLFASYERATRVNWRDSWRNDASGVWVRGGHATDQHDHQDRGHVNYIFRGRPIFIEAGTPAYHHPRMMTHFATGVGHNVLQLGIEPPDSPADAGDYVHKPGWQSRDCVAPIQVRRLDASGGEVTVDATGGYDRLARWGRTVTWAADSMTIADDVVLSSGESDVVLFRWHLGTEQEVTVEGSATNYVISWPVASVTLECDVPIRVTQLLMPDNTLAGHDGSDEPKNVHTCIVVQSASPVAGLQLVTHVSQN